MKVIWTRSSLRELQDIYEYYLENVSLQMAENIRVSVLGAARQIGVNPFSGISEPRLSSENLSYRSVLRGHYKIIYRLDENEVRIVDVFDTRQNPPKLKRHV